MGVLRQLQREDYRSEIPDGYGYRQFCDRLRLAIGRRHLTIGMHPLGEIMHWADIHTGESTFMSKTIIILQHSQFVLDTVYKYPSQVAIMINENNGSTAEQFLLAAKQSRKVKLYGTTTFGVLDISNMYSIPSPCEDFYMWICLSRSQRIPGMTIDSKGIPPDYYIHSSVPKYEWISFVRAMLE